MADYAAPAGNALDFEAVALPYSAPAGDHLAFALWSTSLDVAADFALGLDFDAAVGLSATVSAGFALDLTLDAAAALIWPVAGEFDLSLSVTAEAGQILPVSGDFGPMLDFAATPAESWYVPVPFGSGVRLPWSPQQAIERTVSAPMVQPPRQDRAGSVAWGELEEITAQVAGGWDAVPPLERERVAIPWGDLDRHPESDVGSAYAEPGALDRDGLAIPWDAFGDHLDPAAGLPYTAPPEKDRERVAIPWDDFAEIDRAASLPYSQPPPKDREFTIVSGPYWYPRWCIRQYVPPHGLELFFDFESVPAYAPPHGLELNFNDRNEYPLVCFDGTWNGPKDNYWYRPHPWEVPPVISRRFYVVLNTVNLKRISDNIEIPILGMEIGTDRDAWCWTLRATLRRRQDLELVRPTAGAPVEVEASINGNLWRFVIEEWGDDRAFGRQGYSIAGRSLSAYLAAPYSDPASLVQTSQLTAAQLADEALLYTGFTATFGLTDWLVPAGVYSVQNQTPMQQLLTIAAAAGGTVASDQAATTVSLLPWYAAMPWEWGAATVDAVLPTFRERRSSFEARPQYSGVYVSGQAQGVTCFVKRTGTDGSRQPQMQTDPLITATEAGLARGKRILADSGARSIESITAPLIDNPGLLTPGMLIEVTDSAGNWRGMVIRTSITAQRPTVTQSIDVLRYYGT